MENAQVNPSSTSHQGRIPTSFAFVTLLLCYFVLFKYELWIDQYTDYTTAQEVGKKSLHTLNRLLILILFFLLIRYSVLQSDIQTETQCWRGKGNKQLGLFL